MFVPIGTPVFAPDDGRIYQSGNTIGPATGRWVGIDFDNGMRFRCMHLSRLVRTSGRVKRGDLIAYSGASGYGYEDFRRAPGMPPAHTHVTLWPSWASRFNYDRNGNPYTIDFMRYVGGDAAGGSDARPTPMLKASTKMTIYARRDDGLVVAIPEGGPTYNYRSPAEYNRHRETVAVINGQRQADGQPLVTLPPALNAIVTLPSERLNDLIFSQGAVLSQSPVINVEIPEVELPVLDVDEISKKVNDEIDRRARERLGS